LKERIPIHDGGDLTGRSVDEVLSIGRFFAQQALAKSPFARLRSRSDDRGSMFHFDRRNRRHHGELVAACAGGLVLRVRINE
jgi:hypothetical protein